MALSTTDLAVELMPAFGPGGPANVIFRRGADRTALVQWLLKTQEVGLVLKQLSLLRTRVPEAVQLLEPRVGGPSCHRCDLSCRIHRQARADHRRIMKCFRLFEAGLRPETPLRRHGLRHSPTFGTGVIWS